MSTGAGRGDLTIHAGQLYSFLQRAGDPEHPLELFSLYGAMGGFSIPRSEPEAQYRKSLSMRNQWELWTTLEGPPGDLPTTSFTEKMPRATAALMEELATAERRFTVHTIISETGDPTDPTAWESKEIFTGVRLSNLSRDNTEPNEAGELELSADASFYFYSRLFPIYFGSKAGTEITKEVVGVAVYPEIYRADKDVKEIYVVQKVDGAAPKLVYSKNGGATWTAVNLTAMSTDEPSDIVVVGDYVIICSSAGEAYYFTRKSALSTWSKVTGGFVAAHGPTAMYAPGVGDIWFAGLGGYIYKLGVPGQPVTVVEDGDLTVQNFNDIHGAGNTIMAVGANNAAVISQNRGASFTLLTGPEAATTLNCCRVVGKEALWAGGAKASYSLDAGVTWTESATGIAGLTAVHDIVFCPDQMAVGYVTGVGSGPAGVVMRTSDHGATWEAYSVNAPPTNERINKLAVGGPNYLVAGGLVTAVGGDGMLGLATN